MPFQIHRFLKTEAQTCASGIATAMLHDKRPVGIKINNILVTIMTYDIVIRRLVYYFQSNDFPLQFALENAPESAASNVIPLSWHVDARYNQ